MAPTTGSNFCSITPDYFHFRLLLYSSSFITGVMGRRAKNKQGDPLPLHADPDLNGSSKALKLKSKPGFKDKSSAPKSNTKLGKRKPEHDDDGERVMKKPGGPRSAGKKAAPVKKPTTKAAGKPLRSNGKEVELEEENVMDDDNFVGWEDVENDDMQAAARCVRASEDVDASPNLRVIRRRSLFRDSDATDKDDEDEDTEEFFGFTGGLEDLEGDEDEAEEYVHYSPFYPTTSQRLIATNL